MPCYDPPPPWEGKQQANAYEASRILCRLCKEHLCAGNYLSEELLKWYLVHLEVDLEIATGTYYGNPNHEEVKLIQEQISKVKEQLGND